MENTAFFFFLIKHGFLSWGYSTHYSLKNIQSPTTWSRMFKLLLKFIILLCYSSTNRITIWATYVILSFLSQIQKVKLILLAQSFQSIISKFNEHKRHIFFSHESCKIWYILYRYFTLIVQYIHIYLCFYL